MLINMIIKIENNYSFLEWKDQFDLSNDLDGIVISITEVKPELTVEELADIFWKEIDYSQFHYGRRGEVELAKILLQYLHITRRVEDNVTR